MAHAGTIEQMRARFGLDRPFAEQYRDWLVRAARLDFGRSMQYDRPVRDLIPERAANTAILALTALVFATLIGLPLGVITGSRRGGALPGAIRAASVVLLSMPPLLTSLFLVFVAARTGWLPIAGMRSATVPAGGALLDLLRHLVVPAAALALPLAAMFERLQAQAMSEVIGEPFVLATLARGVPRSRVVWRDALKAALRPVAAVYGLVVGTLLSGSFAVEVITAWPGLGRLMLDALRARDMYLVAGCAGAGSVFLAVGTLMSDAALALVDPRARRMSAARGSASCSSIARRCAGVGAPSSRLTRWTRTSPACSTRRRPVRTCATMPARGTRRSSIRGGSSISSSSATKEDRSTRVPLAWLLGRTARAVGRRARAAAAARRGQLRPRRVQPPAVRRASRSLSLVAAGGHRRHGRRRDHRRRIAGYVGGAGRPADARVGLRARAAGDVRRARAAVGAAARARGAHGVRAARRIFAVVGAPFIARGVRAIVRSERRLDYAVAATSLGASHARVLGAAPAAGRARLHRRRDHDARAGVHRGGSDAVVRRPRVSRSGRELGHDAARCVERPRVRRFSVAAQPGGGDVSRRARVESDVSGSDM